MAKKNLFTYPETFRGMNPKFLWRWLVPYRDYLQRRGLTLPVPDTEGAIDYERLVQIFMEPDSANASRSC